MLTKKQIRTLAAKVARFEKFIPMPQVLKEDVYTIGYGFTFNVNEIPLCVQVDPDGKTSELYEEYLSAAGDDRLRLAARLNVAGKILSRDAPDFVPDLPLSRDVALAVVASQLYNLSDDVLKSLIDDTHLSHYRIEELLSTDAFASLVDIAYHNGKYELYYSRLWDEIIDALKTRYNSISKRKMRRIADNHSKRSEKTDRTKWRIAMMAGDVKLFD